VHFNTYKIELAQSPPNQKKKKGPFVKSCSNKKKTIPWIIGISRGVIDEVRCGFFRIYSPTPYSAVFLLHEPALAPIKIGFGAVR
jgi:hypothetical protein